MLLIPVALLVCLSPAHAQSTSIATLLDQRGNISVIKDPNSTYQTALFAGSQVKVGQIITTGSDGYGKFRIQDGSTFEELLAAGDERMYRDKAVRRSRNSAGRHAAAHSERA